MARREISEKASSVQSSEVRHADVSIGELRENPPTERSWGQNRVIQNLVLMRERFHFGHETGSRAQHQFCGFVDLVAYRHAALHSASGKKQPCGAVTAVRISHIYRANYNGELEIMKALGRAFFSYQ